MNQAEMVQSVDWQVPALLTHATWQSAHADCQALIKQSKAQQLVLDWQLCKQIDSSALAFILDLKRGIDGSVSHQHVPDQLVQLAKLYEVNNVLGLG
jgi:ABC-type transporter Mla MlaB component